MKTIVQSSIFTVLFSLLGCNNLSKEEAYNKVVDDSFHLKDTIIRYSLTSDSLVLEFVKPLQHKYWHGEIFIGERNKDYEVHIHPISDKPGHMGRIHFVNGKVVFKDFHLSEDSLDLYDIRFHAAPYFPGCASRGYIYSPPYLFLPNEKETRILSPPLTVKDFNIVKFDLVQLKKLPWELQKLCRDSIESKYGTVFTDVEIENSSY